jgi:hypothetical protein
LNLGKDLVRGNLVLVCKPGVDQDSIREIGKERRIEGEEEDLKVDIYGQTVKVILILGSSYEKDVTYSSCGLVP